MMLQASNKNYERISRVNSGIESRLTTYTEKLEAQKQRFLRQMIRAQAFLRAECKRLKDEQFRNQNEKILMRQHELGKELQMEEMIESDGLLHGPGVQNRFTRNKNMRRKSVPSSRNRIEKSKSSTDNLTSSESTEDSIGSFEAKSSHLIIAKKHQTSLSNTPSWEIPKSEKSLDTKNKKANRFDSASLSPFSFHTLHSNNRFSLTKTNSCCNNPSNVPKKPISIRSSSSPCPRSSGHHIIKSQSAGLPSRRGILSNNSANRSSTANAQFKYTGNHRNSEEAKNDQPRRKSSLYVPRRRTAPLLNRLAQLKKEIVNEEAEYVLRLRKENQKTENEDITKKVWEFIGKRPVSAFSSYREMASIQSSRKNRSRFDEVISEKENAFLLNRFTLTARN